MDKLVEAVKRILEYEKAHPRKYPSEHLDREGVYCEPWTWQEVGVHWRIIHKLITEEHLVKMVYHSASSKEFALVSHEKAEEFIRKHSKTHKKHEPVLKIPDDLLDDIIGMEDNKKLIMMCLRLLEQPDIKTNADLSHLVLIGVPASGKTFIMELINERIEQSYLVDCANATPVGIVEVLIEQKPKILLLDELEKADVKLQYALLNYMSGDRLRVTKHGKTMEVKHTCMIIGSANREQGIVDKFFSRAKKIVFLPYSDREYREIVINILVKRKGVERELAEYIAEQCIGLDKDVRTAIWVSNIARNKEDVDYVVRILKKGGKIRFK